jgi:hypothetical protein
MGYMLEELPTTLGERDILRSVPSCSYGILTPSRPPFSTNSRPQPSSSANSALASCTIANHGSSNEACAKRTA